MRTQVIHLMTVQELDAELEKLGDGAAAEEPAGPPIEEAGRLRARRARLAAAVDAELLARYDRLRERYARAVVETRRGVCLGCFTRRPTSMANRTPGLDTCERCGRILVQAEPSEAVVEEAAGPRTGASQQRARRASPARRATRSKR